MILSVCVSRCESHVKLAARLHALDMLLELREKASCAMNIVKWLLYCLVNYHSIYFEFICELYYFVLSDFHIVFCFNFKLKMKLLRRQASVSAILRIRVRLFRPP